MGRLKKIILTSKFFNYFDVESLENFQQGLSQYGEFEKAFQEKQQEVKKEESQIKSYNSMVKRVINEESKKLDDLEEGDIDKILDSEDEEVKKTGIQTTINEATHLDKDFFSKKIDDQLNEEFLELKNTENELTKETRELDELKVEQKVHVDQVVEDDQRDDQRREQLEVSETEDEVLMENELDENQDQSTDKNNETILEEQKSLDSN